MVDRLYTILSQEQVRGLDMRSNMIDLYEIHYQGPNDIRGWVRVPVDGASPEAVDTAIRRRLANQLTIHELGES